MNVLPAPVTGPDDEPLEPEPELVSVELLLEPQAARPMAVAATQTAASDRCLITSFSF
jgi:hypothetical protein